MAINIKDAASLQQKYQTRATAAAGDYTKGVQNTTGWAAAASASEANWEQGVTAAAAAKTYSKGVNQAGDSKWQAGAVNKGAQRYPQGVQLGAPMWATNVQPYLSKLSGLTLPPKGPRRSPQNIARVQAVINALIAQKTGKPA